MARLFHPAHDKKRYAAIPQRKDGRRACRDHGVMFNPGPDALLTVLKQGQTHKEPAP
jgi:hypothetical protein